MIACYAPDATFSDPVFPALDAAGVAAMWQMLCARGKDLAVVASDIDADAKTGRARWVATYTFSATGRRVENSIDARFTFRDGRIVRHEDRFDLRRWLRQALGWKGALLGWLPPVQRATLVAGGEGARRLARREGERARPGEQRARARVSRFLREPAFEHDRQTRLGVLLVNLGTPDAPTASAVRRFLAEFLADRRVVEIPPLLWRPILHGIVLRIRPRRTAKKYAMIWGSDGSPLLLHSQKQRTLVTGYLGQKLKDLGLPADFAAVEIGMRYGNPGIATGLAKLKAAGCDRVLVAPLFPQYSAAATASALDATFAHAAGCGGCRRCARSTAFTTIRDTSRRLPATSTTIG
jgi:hypothetical protein